MIILGYIHFERFGSGVRKREDRFNRENNQV